MKPKSLQEEGLPLFFDIIFFAQPTQHATSIFIPKADKSEQRATCQDAYSTEYYQPGREQY